MGGGRGGLCAVQGNQRQARTRKKKEVGGKRVLFFFFLLGLAIAVAAEFCTISSMKISVKTLKGNHFDLVVNPTDTVCCSSLFVFRVLLHCSLLLCQAFPS